MTAGRFCLEIGRDTIAIDISPIRRRLRRYAAERRLRALFAICHAATRANCQLWAPAIHDQQVGFLQQDHEDGFVILLSAWADCIIIHDIRAGTPLDVHGEGAFLLRRAGSIIALRIKSEIPSELPSSDLMLRCGHSGLPASKIAQHAECDTPSSCDNTWRLMTASGANTVNNGTVRTLKAYDGQNDAERHTAAGTDWQYRPAGLANEPLVTLDEGKTASSTAGAPGQWLLSSAICRMKRDNFDGVVRD